jgi:hypothetical protein
MVHDALSFCFARGWGMQDGAVPSVENQQNFLLRFGCLQWSPVASFTAQFSAA